MTKRLQLQAVQVLPLILVVDDDSEDMPFLAGVEPVTLLPSQLEEFASGGWRAALAALQQRLDESEAAALQEKAEAAGLAKPAKKTTAKRPPAKRPAHARTPRPRNPHSRRKSDGN